MRWSHTPNFQQDHDWFTLIVFPKQSEKRCICNAFFLGILSKDILPLNAPTLAVYPAQMLLPDASVSCVDLKPLMVVSHMLFVKTEALSAARMRKRPW